MAVGDLEVFGEIGDVGFADHHGAVVGFWQFAEHDDGPHTDAACAGDHAYLALAFEMWGVAIQAALDAVPDKTAGQHAAVQAPPHNAATQRGAQ